MQKTGKIILCAQCGSEFYAPKWAIEEGRLFCSTVCYHDSTKGIPTWSKDKKFSDSHREAIIKAHKGIKFPNRKKAIISPEHRKRISVALKGRRLSKSHIENISGNNSHRWKGSAVGYVGLHLWVKKVLGKPTQCQNCGKDGLTGRKIHWHNKSRKYLRKADDWERLCSKCHAAIHKQHKITVED